MTVKARPQRLRFGVFEVDSVSGDLWKHGVHVKLHDKPFQVLQALLERPGEIVTRKELQERLWPADTFVEFENGLNNAISRLRETLGDAADSPRFIETVPRRGYRFIAAVEIPGEPRDAAPTANESASVSARRGLSLLALGLTGAVILAVLLYRAVGPSSHPIHSVAVLPFVTAGAGDDSPDEYVAFGMTEALIAELSQAGALKVISQTSILRYKDHRKPLPEIARELGVGAIVEGSVVREGEQVRITVQLIEAASDTHLWAETYRRQTASVLVIQSELARSVAGEIRARLTGEAKATIQPSTPTNPAAEEAYLKGRYFLSRRGEQNMARARGYFEQAIAADPRHARAYAALADYYSLTDSIAPELALLRARTFAQKALELNDGLADAHVSLAYVYYYADWNWREAEAQFLRAIEIDPNHAQARYWYGRFLGTMGRYQEATAQIERALQLDPLSNAVLDSAAMQAFFLRRFDKMIEHANRILELDSNDYRAYEHLTVAYLFSGRLPEALSAAQRGLALLPREPLFVLLQGIAQVRLGKTSEGEQMLAELERMNREGYVPVLFRAIAHAQLGKEDQAVDLTQLAYRDHDPYMVMIKALPWFDPIRTDARFQELLRKMNFPP